MRESCTASPSSEISLTIEASSIVLMELDKLQVDIPAQTKFVFSQTFGFSLPSSATSFIFAISVVSEIKLVPPHVVATLGFETLTLKGAVKYAESYKVPLSSKVTKSVLSP